jgi:hypothetical protein
VEREGEKMNKYKQHQRIGWGGSETSKGFQAHMLKEELFLSSEDPYFHCPPE